MLKMSPGMSPNPESLKFYHSRAYSNFPVNMNIPDSRTEPLTFHKTFWIGRQIWHAVCKLYDQWWSSGGASATPPLALLTPPRSDVTRVTDLEDDVEVASDFQEIFGVGSLLSVMLDVIYEGLGRPTVSICFVIVMSWQSSGRKFVS